MLAKFLGDLCCPVVIELAWDIIVTKTKRNSGIFDKQGPEFLFLDLEPSSVMVCVKFITGLEDGLSMQKSILPTHCIVGV